MEIGLPQALMVQLQVTDYDLGWDAITRQARERFLKQGHILVVDRRCGVPISYLAAPRRGQASGRQPHDRSSLAPQAGNE